MLFNPESQACAAIVDARSTFTAQAQDEGRIPSLRDVRSVRGASNTGFMQLGLVGVEYKLDRLKALSSGVLYTRMIVHTNGLGVATPFGHLFTTATNRTQKTIEVVGLYTSVDALIGLFDWSCAPADPCPGGQTGAAWMWTYPFTMKDGCYVTSMDDRGGHVHDTLYYANASERVGERWWNQVAFWNECSNTWDLVYTHAFGGDQVDCSITEGGEVCAWWGPGVEPVFTGAPVAIPELGFFNSLLIHDGEVSTLDEHETNWLPPGDPIWSTCHRTMPNSDWTVASVCP
jgi:hypothetical protein